MDIGPYDTTKIILIKQAISDGNALPNFFRIQNSESELSSKPIIEDFRNLVKAYSTIRQIDQVLTLARSFSLPVSDSFCLWIESAGIKLKITDYAILANFSRDFVDEDRYEHTKNNLEKRIKIAQISLREKLTSINSLTKALGPVPPGPEPSFSVDGEEIDFSVSFKQSHGLVDIFDKISASRDIPFLACITGSGRTFYKVYEGIVPSEQWIDSSDLVKEGIFFKIYTSSTLTTPDEAYATAVWKSNGVISVSYKTRKARDVKERIKTIIYESLELDKGGYKLEGLHIYSQRSVFVSGIFSYRMDYNPYILAYLLTLNPLVEKFAFINEKEKTEPRKDMFRLYFSFGRDINEYSTSEAIQINIFSIAKETESLGIYKIRIRHCSDLLTARASIHLFSRLYQEYMSQSPSIYEFYSENALSKKVVMAAKNKTRVQATDKKTKQRLIDLKNYDLVLFGSGYSGQCQSNKQPYIVAKAREDGKIPKEVLALRKKFEGSDFADKKIMLFDGHYYASEIPGEKTQTPYKYPGLKANKDTSTKSTAYREDYPCLPCSFTKPKSYVLPDVPVDPTECISDKARKGDTGGDYISETKPPGPGKLSDMPFNLSKLAELSGLMRNIEGKGKKKNKHYPYLRYGIVESPHSFILALEAATNFDNYSTTIDSDRGVMVQKAIEGMVAKFPAGKQELYDISFERLQRNLIKQWSEDPNRYLEPSVFVSLAEAYYKVNIVLFTMETSGFLDDEFLIPRHTEACLPKKYVDQWPTVVIIRQVFPNGLWPYQCSLLRKLELKNKKQVEISLFTNDDFVNIIKKMYHQSWTVYSASSEGYFEYRRDFNIKGV